MTPSTEAPNRIGRARLAALFALTAAAGLSPGLVDRFPVGSLFPWIGLVAAAAALPVFLARRLDLFEPATFAVWTHFAPAFVVGSVLLALHVVEYPFPGLVRDPQRALVLTLVLTASGLAALALGAASGTAAAAGLALGRWLPRLEADGRTVGPLGIALATAVGIVGSLVAFRQGIIGFQAPGGASWTGVAGYYLSWCLPLAHFLYWFRLFRSPLRPPAWSYFFPLFVVVYTVVLWGNRGGVLSCYLVAAFAFRLARGPLTLRASAVAVLLSFVALGTGMVFGSALRLAKGGETPVAVTASASSAPSAPSIPRAPSGPLAESGPLASSGRRRPTLAPDSLRPAPPSAAAPEPTMPPPGALAVQLSASRRAVETVASSPFPATVTNLLRRVAERLDLLSHASVTVARASAMRPLERDAGVVSVGTAMVSGLVPRVLWPGKPRAGDARTYAKLYFGWDGNSFAVTFAADVFRSWGPWAVIPALALLGAMLGLLAAALVGGDARPDAGRAALWALLLLAVPWEGFYGLVGPSLLRVGVAVIFGLLFVAAAGRTSRRPAGY